MNEYLKGTNFHEKSWVVVSIHRFICEYRKLGPLLIISLQTRSAFIPHLNKLWLRAPCIAKLLWLHRSPTASQPSISAAEHSINLSTAAWEQAWPPHAAIERVFSPCLLFAIQSSQSQALKCKYQTMATHNDIEFKLRNVVGRKLETIKV